MDKDRTNKSINNIIEIPILINAKALKSKLKESLNFCMIFLKYTIYNLVLFYVNVKKKASVYKTNALKLCYDLNQKQET